MISYAQNFEDVILHLADNVHFTRTAVKLQRQYFIAIHQLHRRRFPAFNIADSCITIGVALMVADLFSWKSPPDSSAKII